MTQQLFHLKALESWNYNFKNISLTFRQTLSYFVGFHSKDVSHDSLLRGPCQSEAELIQPTTTIKVTDLLSASSLGVKAVVEQKQRPVWADSCGYSHLKRLWLSTTASSNLSAVFSAAFTLSIQPLKSLILLPLPVKTTSLWQEKTHFIVLLWLLPLRKSSENETSALVKLSDVVFFVLLRLKW